MTRIEIKIIRNIGPWTNYSKTSQIYLTEESNQYNFPFTMEDASDPKARLVVYGGNSDIDFEIMDISLTEELVETSINPIVKTDEVQCYPNPAGDYVFVSFHLAAESEIELQLFNLAGQLIESVHYGKRFSGDQEILFNTEELASGAYVLHLRNGFNNRSTILLTGR